MGYSYQVYRDMYPDIHEKLYLITDLLKDHHDSEFLGDLHSPPIFDKKEWCKYLNVSIQKLLEDATY